MFYLNLLCDDHWQSFKRFDFSALRRLHSLLVRLCAVPRGSTQFIYCPTVQSPVKTFLLTLHGLTVVTATWFMTSILAVAKVWPNFTKLLKLAAALVLLLAISKIAVSQDHIDTLLNRLMGYLTLAIVATIFILAALQTRRRVEEANLVFCGIKLSFGGHGVSHLISGL